MLWAAIELRNHRVPAVELPLSNLYPQLRAREDFPDSAVVSLQLSGVFRNLESVEHTGPSAMAKQLEQLASELGEALAARHWRVTCAESCTGGGIAAAITSVAGSSGWFDVAFVTYSDTHKHELLGISSAILETYGAVSRQVVAAMARGARERAGADVAVAVSGIAGPDGGTAEKPVGTVWIGWSTARDEKTVCFNFNGDRAAVRHQTVVEALRGLLDQVKNTG